MSKDIFAKLAIRREHRQKACLSSALAQALKNTIGAIGKVARRAFGHACAQRHGLWAEPISAALLTQVVGALKHLQHGEQRGFWQLQVVAKLGQRLPFRVRRQLCKDLNHAQDGTRACQGRFGQQRDIKHDWQISNSSQSEQRIVHTDAGTAKLTALQSTEQRRV